jgi:hypothetical protein
MSENLDLVRTIYEAWGQSDDHWIGLIDPAIEFEIADGPSPGTWNGLAGLKQGWRTFLDAWDGFHAAADEYRVIDDDQVLVLDSFRGRGKLSGLEVDAVQTQGALLFQVRDGLVTHIALYLTRDRALADLGLEE